MVTNPDSRALGRPPVLDAPGPAGRHRARTTAVVVSMAVAATLTGLVVTPAASAPVPGAPGPIEGSNGRIVYLDLGPATCGDCRSIATINPDGTDRRVLVRRPGVIDATWSPGGRRILYTHYLRGSQGNIWVMGARGQNKTRLLGGRRTEASPSWAASGRRFVYVSSGEFSSTRPRPHLRIYNFRTGRTRPVLDRNAFRHVTDLAWSPDGRRIAFVGSPADGPDDRFTNLYTVRPDGTGLRQVTHSPQVIESTPAWSPNGRRLVYHTAKPSFGDFANFLRILRRGQVGSDAQRLPGLLRLGPTWAPDGRHIATSGVDILTVAGTNRHRPFVGVDPDWQRRPGTLP